MGWVSFSIPVVMGGAYTFGWVSFSIPMVVEGLAFEYWVSFSIPVVARGLFLCGWRSLFVSGIVFNTRGCAGTIPLWVAFPLLAGYRFQYL